MTGQDGGDLSFGQLKGRVVLIFFGFTNCPDVCPMTLAGWRKLELSGQIDREDVAFVLISVDGERDTPPVLREFLHGFSDSFLGMTGPPAKIKPIAKQFSAAFFRDSPTGAAGHYSVSHSPQAYVLDPEGKLRAEFFNPTVESMAGMINALLEEAAATTDAG